MEAPILSEFDGQTTELTRQAIANRTLKIICRSLTRPREIAEDHTLIGDLGLKSLDLVEVIMGLENEFEIEISEEDRVSVIAEGPSTVESLIDFVCQKIAH